MKGGGHDLFISRMVSQLIGDSRRMKMGLKYWPVKDILIPWSPKRPPVSRPGTIPYIPFPVLWTYFYRSWLRLLDDFVFIQGG
jgi:hypothetical protein